MSHGHSIISSKLTEKFNNYYLLKNMISNTEMNEILTDTK